MSEEPRRGYNQRAMPDEEKTSDSTRGRLKVFLGYASGVGKSFRLFDEGRRRHDRGEDVVVGAIDGDPNADVQAIVQQIEMVPMLELGGRRAVDVEAVLARRPAVCLMDNLA